MDVDVGKETAMDLGLQGKIALVTGASVGLGRAVSVLLAREGAQAVVVARRLPLLEELARQIEHAGGLRPLVISADLCEPEAPMRVAGELLQEFGRCDILVNNAGGSRPLPIDAEERLWEEALALNFHSVRRMGQALLPAMRSNRWGRIINVTGSLEPRQVNGANVAKAGVQVWAKGLACEVAREGITVNCIGPGRIHSEQIDRRLYPTPEDQAEFAAENIPLGYFGEPEDFGHLVVFLASERARYITGQSLYVDGGMHRAV